MGRSRRPVLRVRRAQRARRARLHGGCRRPPVPLAVVDVLPRHPAAVPHRDHRAGRARRRSGAANDAVHAGLVAAGARRRVRGAPRPEHGQRHLRRRERRRRRQRDPHPVQRWVPRDPVRARQPRAMVRACVAFYAVAIAIGFLLAAERGWWLLAIGAVGVVLSLAYTAPPFRLVHRGLGEPVTALGFGPVMTLGAYFVCAQQWSWEAFYISLPVALLIALVLYVNQIPDRAGDEAVGKRTLIVRWPETRVITAYELMAGTAFVLIALGPVLGITPWWTLIALVTVPMAWKVVRGLRASYGQPVRADAGDADEHRAAPVHRPAPRRRLPHRRAGRLTRDLDRRRRRGGGDRDRGDRRRLRRHRRLTRRSRSGAGSTRRPPVDRSTSETAVATLRQELSEQHRANAELTARLRTAGDAARPGLWAAGAAPPEPARGHSDAARRPPGRDRHRRRPARRDRARARAPARRGRHLRRGHRRRAREPGESPGGPRGPAGRPGARRRPSRSAPTSCGSRSTRDGDAAVVTVEASGWSEAAPEPRHPRTGCRRAERHARAAGRGRGCSPPRSASPTA